MNCVNVMVLHFSRETCLLNSPSGSGGLSPGHSMEKFLWPNGQASLTRNSNNCCKKKRLALSSLKIRAVLGYRRSYAANGTFRKNHVSMTAVKIPGIHQTLIKYLIYECAIGCQSANSQKTFDPLL